MLKEISGTAEINARHGVPLAWAIKPKTELRLLEGNARNDLAFYLPFFCWLNFASQISWTLAGSTDGLRVAAAWASISAWVHVGAVIALCTSSLAAACWIDVFIASV